MKHANIKSVTYIDCVVENNDKDSKLKHGDHVKISKWNNILQYFILKVGQNKILHVKKLKTQYHVYI